MGRPQRVGRRIAARFLAYWRDGANPRAITADKAREAFRFWESASALRQWPKRELDAACEEAATWIVQADPGMGGDFLRRALTYARGL